MTGVRPQQTKISTYKKSDRQNRNRLKPLWQKSNKQTNQHKTVRGKNSDAQKPRDIPKPQLKIQRNTKTATRKSRDTQNIDIQKLRKAKSSTTTGKSSKRQIGYKKWRINTATLKNSNKQKRDAENSDRQKHRHAHHQWRTKQRQKHPQNLRQTKPQTNVKLPTPKELTGNVVYLFNELNTNEYFLNTIRHK